VHVVVSRAAGRYVKRQLRPVYIWHTPVGRSFAGVHVGSDPPPGRSFVPVRAYGVELQVDEELYETSETICVVRRVVPPWGLAARTRSGSYAVH
jgi:hypothetical protein